MYDSLRSARIISIILLALGVVLFALELVVGGTVSLFGLVVFICGFGLYSLMRAVRTELEKLRVENAELRQQLKDRWRR